MDEDDEEKDVSAENETKEGVTGIPHISHYRLTFRYQLCSKKLSTTTKNRICQSKYQAPSMQTKTLKH